MIRILPVILIILVLGAVGYWKLNAVKNQAQNTSAALPVSNPGQKPETGSVNSATTNVADASLSIKVTSLENEIIDLKSRVAILEKKPTTTTAKKTTASSKVPVYIPIGTGGSNSNTNWANMPGYEISLDPAEYSGYTSMQLEVNMRLSSAGGDAMTRLATSDGSAISSELSTPNTLYSLKTSSGFKLPSGRKTYMMQIKSSAGQEIFIQDARIKVNF